MPLTIVEVGDPILRKIVRPLALAEIHSREIQQLIAEMHEAMRAAPGVGLAAPQVGRPIQLAVIEDRLDYHKNISPEQLAARERKAIPFHVLINPELVWQSDEAKNFFEGCLSLAGYSAIVPRAQSVKVEYLDDRGNPRSLEATGWYARILQHEIDHLQGCLYVDRMLTRTFTSLENLAEFWNKQPPADALAKLE